MLDESKPLFIAVAEQIEYGILDGTYQEDTPVPSTNELAAFLRINPATAGKGLNRLADAGVLVKRRGVGMFVAVGAAELLRQTAARCLRPRLHRPAAARSRAPGHRPPRTHRDDHEGGVPMSAIETRNLSKHFRDVAAIDDVSLSFAEGRVHGLLGRNGAGKTTLMKLLTGQIFASSGEHAGAGREPRGEPAGALSDLLHPGEPEVPRRLPAPGRAADRRGALSRMGPGARPAELVADFRLPEKRAIRKLSRGQLSAVGIIIGLASRAPLTFFDEPYLGLDAVARRLFFDRLLADFAEHPRTVILLHPPHRRGLQPPRARGAAGRGQGRDLARRPSAAERRDRGLRAPGRGRGAFIGEVRGAARSPAIGALATATILTDGETTAAAARAAGLDVAPVSLQNYIVHRTTAAAPAAAR